MAIGTLLAEEPPVAPAHRAGNMVTLSDFGAEDLGYLTLPQSAPKGGIVLVHDRYGLDDVIKSRVDALAAMGYLTLAVDLYNGRVIKPGSEASLGEIRPESSVRIIRAGARLLKTSPKLKVPQVGVIGYGVNGSVCLVAGAAETDERLLDAIVLMEGPLAPDEAVLKRLRCPVVVVASDRRNAEVEMFRLAMDERGRDCRVKLVPAMPGFLDAGAPGYSGRLSRQLLETVTADYLDAVFSRPATSPDVFDRIGDSLDKGVETVRDALK
jgi:carboxymethylenebutenolidase